MRQRIFGPVLAGIAPAALPQLAQPVRPPAAGTLAAGVVSCVAVVGSVRRGVGQGARRVELRA
ncbi:hypothetical protein [Dactylosporangium sp. NPDC005555]|uniref:hypothetical protein n=1 Tax=Dactylosporangium sp. NPDC005555 TaxID=3154889 RepID=UPI0033BAC376